MEFKLNTSGRETKINRLFDEQIALIQSQLAKGERTIELYIDKEYASDVRDKLEVALKGQPINFQIVRRSPNPFTGVMQNFTGEVIGDNRYYKLYYYAD